MFTITIKNVNPEFVFCFIAVNKINYADLQLKKSKNWTIITNQKILKSIKACYETFLSSGMNLEQFFGCQIVNVTLTRKNIFHIECSEIRRFPVFMVWDRNGRVQHGASLGQFNSDRPIKMSIDLIFAIHGKPSPTNFSPRNFPADVEIYTVADGQAVNTPDSLGRSKCETVILIGYESSHDGQEYYWLPNRSLIQKQFKCTKYPGKCLYKTNQSCHYNRHVETCTDETIVTSKQVCLNCIVYTI